MKVFSDKSGEIIKILIICTKVHLLSKIANTLKLIGLFLLFQTLNIPDAYQDERFDPAVS